MQRKQPAQEWSAPAVPIFPNQVNNVVAFPGIFKGALEGRAVQITEEMKLAAARAIAGLVPDDKLNEENICGGFRSQSCRAVAEAVNPISGNRHCLIALISQSVCA